MLGGVVGRQAALLRRARPFGLLWLATLGSGLGTGVATIALVVDVWDRTGSGKWVSALLLVEFLPMLAIGLLLGPLVDRLSRRRLMIWSDLVRAGVFAALPFVSEPALIVALAAVAGFATGFFRPAVYAGMPNLVDEEDLPQANALFQAVENLTWMLGPLLGGVLLSVFSPDVPYAANAVTFLVSAALIARVPAWRLQQGGGAESEGHLADLAAGFRLVRGSRALMTVLVAWTVAMLGLAAVNVAEVALVKVSFDAGDFGLGLLMASAGLGLICGSVFGGEAVERWPIAYAYGGALALMAVGIGLAAMAPGVWIAAVFVVVSGFGNGVAGVCNPVLVQRGAPDHLRGRAFTLIMSVNAAAFGVGMVVAGVLTDAVGPRWVWGLAAALLALVAGLAAGLARGIQAPAEADVTPLPVAAAAAPQAVQGAERI
jgi:MFS family permease